MRSKHELCPVTGAQCYAPDCTDERCDFQDPDNGRHGITEGRRFMGNDFSSGNYSKQTDVSPDPAIETRVENTEKAVTDLYWQLRQLKEKWEGKKDE